MFFAVSPGGVGTKHESRDLTYPLEDPVLFEFGGRKGALQVFGNRRPPYPRHLRASYWLSDDSHLAGGLRLVSVPAGAIPLNPQGWSPMNSRDWPLARRFQAFASSRDWGSILQDEVFGLAMENLKRVIDNAAVAIELLSSRVIVDKFSDSVCRADRIKFLHRVKELLEVIPPLSSIRDPRAPRESIGRSRSLNNSVRLLRRNAGSHEQRSRK